MVAAFGLEYVPKRQKTVGYGDSLEFLNADPAVLGGPGHSLTHLNPFGPPRFDTGVVPVGALAKVAGVEALTPGKYPFFCRIHPFMKSKISVVGGSIDPAPIAP